MKRRGLANIVIVLTCLAIMVDSLVLLSAQQNPSSTVLRAKFIEVSKKYNIPSVILMGIAYTESGFRQFDLSGNPIIHTNSDGSIDIGIMQINSTGRTDIERLKNDVFYNIEVGAKILDNKWKITPPIGDSDRNILENWYYAIWAYNGFSYINYPLNPEGRHYQDKVIDNISKLIIGDDGQPLWTPVTITKPDPKLITTPPQYIDTPTPYHFGDLYENPTDNARIIQANTELKFSTKREAHIQFLVQNVGTSTWTSTLFSKPYSAKLTLTNGSIKIEKTFPITRKVQPGEVLLLDFPCSISVQGNYQATLEFFNKDNAFGQKVLTSFTFDDFDIEDLNSTNLEVSNYTLNLNYKTDYLSDFIPYMYVVYRNGSNILSKEIIQGSNENGLITFTFLPNFKPVGSVDIDVYVVFSSSSSLTETFSYFYSKTYSVNFTESNGIILDSYPTASILVDGLVTNLSTRAFVPLTQGDHTISLTKDGYNPYSFNINYSSFDYIFLPLKANSNIAPQASVSSFDFGNLLSNEASFTNITVFASEKNSQMYLFSNSKMFSLFPSSLVGLRVITVIADARWGNIGKNSGSISFSYNGVKNSIKLSSTVEVVGANLMPNPNDFTVRVGDELFFDVLLSSNAPLGSLSFKVDYPKDYLEFVNYQSNYITESDASLNFSFDILNFQNDTPLIGLTFKAIKETDYKLVVSFSNVKSDTSVSVFSKSVSLTILPPFVKPSKVENIKLENNVGKVQFSFSQSLKGSYDIKRYEIFRSSQPDITTSIFVGDTTTTTFTDSGPFEYGITYYYWVIAVDEKENASDPSDVFSVKPIVFSDTLAKDVKLEFYIGSPFIYINGIKMPMDTAPIIIDGRTFVPVRYIVEPLGAKVVWKNTGSVIIIFKNSVIELFISNPLASVNGNPVPIDKDNPKISPFIKDGRTMVPLRFILENFGAEVNWDGKLKKITIIYKA